MTNSFTPAVQGLPALLAENNCAHAVIEAHKGCRNKYKYNPELGLFELHKVLPMGMFFPFDFGFIPSTVGEDGDPIDVLVMMDEPTFIGCVAKVRLLGVIKARQREANSSKWIENHRLLAVPVVTHLYRQLKDIDGVAETVLFEIEHFFVSYNAAQNREFKVDGREGIAQAVALLKKASKELAARL
jgi:inorganic pyrophosphatase